MNIQETINQFSNKTIVVIGDIMLDRYIYGQVDRISPEAPIPIVQHRETQVVPGGAGNTAANLSTLGAKCYLLGALGEDRQGPELKEILESFGIITTYLITDTRPTTEKIRVLGNHQQIVRIDFEAKQPLTHDKTAQLCTNAKAMLPNCDAIIVCDYAKGVISQELMQCIKKIALEQQIPLLADVRPEHKLFYKDLTFITPNKKEASAMIGKDIRTISDAKQLGLALANELKTNILLTMSEDGMLIINHGSDKVTHLPTKAQEVIDVSGAGDTVIATMALAKACHAPDAVAATLANHAASVVVAKLGTARVNQEELLQTFMNQNAIRI